LNLLFEKDKTKARPIGFHYLKELRN